MKYIDIDIREMKPGEWLDNIPLVACPACGKTSFLLGQSFDWYNWRSDVESYAHVVEDMTSIRGIVVEYCDYKLSWWDRVKRRIFN